LSGIVPLIGLSSELIWIFFLFYRKKGQKIEETFFHDERHLKRKRLLIWREVNHGRLIFASQNFLPKLFKEFKLKKFLLFGKRNQI